MTLNITIDVPPELEQKLRHNSADLASEVKEGYAVDLYRRGILDRFELSKILGVDRFEVEACLMRHNVFDGSLTREDLEDDYRTLQRLFNVK